jgi:hypothetical protein
MGAEVRAATSRRRGTTGAVIVIGLAATFAATTGVLVALTSSPYDVSGAILVGPILIAVSVPILAREAKRQNDPRLFRFLMIALVIKVLGTLVRYYVTFHVYPAADATAYHQQGIQISQQLKAGTYAFDYAALDGSPSISFFTGIVYTIIGPTKLGGFLFFSWLAFWGFFLLYKAFVLAVPEGNARTYGLLLFFLPSLVYWPSSIGKDAWMVFTLGIAAYGIARALSGEIGRGLITTGFGLWLMAFVRPHIAGMVAIALGFAYLIQHRQPSRSILKPIARIVGAVAVIVLASIMVQRSAEFLGIGDLSTSGVVAELEETAVRSDQGGSEFRPVIVRSPAQLPAAIATVLFRPFPFEANNAQALAASLEAAFLLCLLVIRYRWVWNALKRMRDRPYIAFAAAYTGIFIVAFASFPNFGLLARERVQVLPFFLLFLAIPPSSPVSEEMGGQDLETRERASPLR